MPANKTLLPSLPPSGWQTEPLINDTKFSESLANQYIHQLAHSIGYHIVGSAQLNHSFQYPYNCLLSLKFITEQRGFTRYFVITWQINNGAHLFEFMGKK
ncbi:hypothetical protein PtA15_2A884 [Puccinia triticina]|uniref:Uncharacterized protein n=1 Tax=Puccinia triticina TaxID=208348 RepID=A0ABY7CDN3_9BASI|nr:uncharacterized protein PtA15_2A884 [Puccinia triticina]WAQ82567.1 hypothetical protein PtA15_2A884 [Puccinia triticina]WAR53428.1 hypothetical protein PtB15_2B859 [Puccinia triticina]